MENALDTLRTAFPHPDLLSPTEDMEADTDGRTLENRKYRSELYLSTSELSSQFVFFHEAIESWTKEINLDKVIWIHCKSSDAIHGLVFLIFDFFRRLFLSKISPSLNISDLHPKVTYCFGDGSSVSHRASFVFLMSVFEPWTWQTQTFSSIVTAQVLNGTSLSGLESFIGEQERLLCGPNVTEKDKRSCELHSKDNKPAGKPPGTGSCC